MQQKKRRNSANPLDPKRLAGDINDEFEMSTLVRKTDVPSRQIRYWISVGAVDKPAGKSRTARYSNMHAQQVMHVRERLELGEQLKAIAHRRQSNPDRIVEASRIPGSNGDGNFLSTTHLWHRIDVTNNLHIYARVGRTNLEIDIANAMSRVANSMLKKAMNSKLNKQSK